PAVRSIVPAGRTITTSLLLLVVSAFAASTAPRRVAQDVVQTGGEAVSPVPVTVIVVVAACAGTRAIERAMPRRRAPAVASTAGRTSLRVLVITLPTFPG